MNIDMRRFHATFFEESREGLEAMESGLLALEQGSRDGELVNSIFRAAHSIKGGSATFGFDNVAALTPTRLPRINVEPTLGKIVVPSELKNCAKVRRLDAVLGAPSRLINGLATTCTVVMPIASTNSAIRKTAKVPDDDAGMNSTQPTVISNSPTAAVCM